MSSDYDFIGLSKASVSMLLDPGQITTLKPGDVLKSLNLSPSQMFYAYALAQADDFEYHLLGLGVGNSMEIAKKVENTDELKDVLLKMKKSKNSKRMKFKRDEVVAMVSEIKQIVNAFNTRKSCWLRIQLMLLHWILIPKRSLSCQFS